MHLAAACTLCLAACAAAGQLEVSVVDAEGKAMPCRVHLTVDGKPVYAEGLPRYERDGHFACLGSFAVEAPAGTAKLLIERGPEYEPFIAEEQIGNDGATRVQAKLRRWIDMNERGWYSGDLHVHRSPQDMPLLLRAEDLNVAPVLTHWNQRRLPTRPPHLHEVTGTTRPRAYHTLAQEDERGGGAILLFNLKEPITLSGVTRWCPSGFAYHEKALEREGAVIEVEKPFWWEAPVHVALGRVDTMGIVCNHFNRTGLLQGEAWGHPRDRKLYPGALGFAHNVLDLYYRYLNLGYPIPASAGSASGVLKNPVGYNRAYVQLDRFSYRGWFDGLCEGRNFVTNGPMLFATVNGKPIGTRFMAKGSFEATVAFDVSSRDPLEKAEIVVGGKVVATFEPKENEPRRIAGSRRLTVERSTWIAVRAFEPARGWLVRFAHTSPFYVTLDGKRPSDPAAARFYVQWIDELIAKVEAEQTKARDKSASEPVLDTYRRARTVYNQAVAPLP